MSDQESQLKALESLLRPLEDGRTEIVVTYRRYEDYEAYERRIAELEQQNAQLQNDLFKWTLTGTQYIDALDELKRLRSILRANHIEF